MKKYYLLSLLLVILIFQNCKKKTNLKEKFTVTGRIYKNCNEVAANTTFYFVFDWAGYGFKRDAPIPFTTDVNGFFSYEFEKQTMDIIIISASTLYSNNFYGHKLNDESIDLGIIKQGVSSQLILKLKTNHLISNLDTIKYVFQYGNFQTPIYGPITKDTIIGSYTMGIYVNSYNNDPSDGEQKILWWNFGMTNSTNQTRVDYTIHGCAAVADTAYIIVP